MALPAVDQFNEAVQNPQSAFTDPVLKSAQPKTNAYGIPQALGGSFALTYTFTSAAGQKWAVRCFHKAVAGLGERYARISQTLNRLNNRYFVKFEYQPQGIRVNGAAYPIVKMEWVDGETLGSHLDRNYRDKASLLTLRNQFRQLEGFLRGQNIAHGDLQNGNVMVGLDVRLIDYDGLYVPDLPTGHGTELGHRHFQHPRRQASDHGPALDRFSFIAIDLALSAVAEKPELFRQFSTGENILFTANDYLDPDQSKVFQALRAIPALKPAVDRFAQACAGPVAAVPTLDAFLTPSAAVAVTPRAAQRVPTVQPSISAPLRFWMALTLRVAWNWSGNAWNWSAESPMSNTARHNLERRNRMSSSISATGGGKFSKSRFGLKVWTISFRTIARPGNGKIAGSASLAYSMRPTPIPDSAIRTSASP